MSGSKLTLFSNDGSSLGMTDVTSTAARRPQIEIPGDVLEPRSEFAHNTLGVSDKTAQRMNLPTTYVGGVAYVPRNASLKIIADGVRQRNQQPQRRRGRR
jgi:hypothetical protein